MNRVVPTLQPVIPNPQIPPPVTNSARSTPLLLVEETGETQNATVIEETQAASNTVFVTNFQQPSAAMVSIKEQESVWQTFGLSK